MILRLATRYQKEVAFFMIYSFLVSGLCSFVYGRNRYVPQRGQIVWQQRLIKYPDKLSAVMDGTENTLQGIPATGPLEQLIKDEKEAPAKQTGHEAPDIGGPSQPEMTAFKPVGADNMVDPFTGDFSYNIPLLDVGGYPVNIFYNSGITMDQEASWVGLGWNINPGAINRNMRGLPDDFDGTEKIIKEQYSRPDTTWGVNVGGKLEVLGGAGNLGIDGGIFYNNIRGLGLEAGIRPSISISSKTGDEKTAPLSVGWRINGNSQSGGSSTFSIGLNDNNKKGLDGSLTASVGIHSRQGMQALHLDAEYSNAYKFEKNASFIRDGAEIHPTLGTSISFAYPSFMPAMRSRITSENYDIDLAMGTAFSSAFPHLRLGGYYSQQRIRREDIKIEQQAFGMLHLQKGQQNSNALMDFNRINDGVYTRSSPAIAVPVYTYDVFSVTGEGTGGSFRAYRGDLGYVKDATVETNGTSNHLGFEIGGGSYGHGGLNIRSVLTPSRSGEWVSGNPARNSFRFRESNKDTQAVYFKNPGEKAIPSIAYQDAIGGEDLVRLKMLVNAPGSAVTVPAFVRYSDMLQKKDDLPLNSSAGIKKRDKRTQVISFLTADEADRVGLNRTIKYISEQSALDTTKVLFGCNAAGIESMRRFDQNRLKHHISEIDVLMPDGRRYVYDLPVYNLGQTDVTFNLTGSGNGTSPNSHLSNYIAGTDNVPEANTKGKDHFVEKQLTPPYAHSYLLTALLSPNYVDVKGDGITEDDMGDAIKFNYQKCQEPIKWRTPDYQNQATLSEGLKTDKNDDKGHYIYGEREQWYLYSIESKNMVARFYVKSDRKDSRSVLGEEGGINPGYGAYKLHKISLFTKGELLKRPNNPRPVKTVHFKYDYSLCPNVSHNSGQAEYENGVNINAHNGKLTLKEIYFTYNGNNRGKRNVYKFFYPEGAGNPAYSYTANDRWGTYKPENDISGASTNGNPDGLRNADYPYAPKDATVASVNAKAWTLNKIKLPSGATLEVDFESDDYAFVQDRRASHMYSISGFGTSADPSVYSNKLYDGPNQSFEYIYVTVPRAITASTPSAIRNQIQEWYLGNFSKNKQLYMKLAVNMPADQNGSGYELIPVYAVVNDFGLIANTGGQKIWLKVQRLLSGYTPMVHYSLQFLKSNLPSKAYPGYDVSEAGGFRAVVKAMGGLFHSFKEIFNGGMKLMMSEGKCKTTDLTKSFIRLTDPFLKKPGGGLRVKKVVIHDNWDKMTSTGAGQNNGMVKSTYGQEYFYTKKELVNGEWMTISSGVASWEPALGADENPHRQAIEYYNKTPKADYDYQVMETPIPEMLYPSASVGYSRVETRSIHRDTVKNAPGIAVTEFYTTREFPTISSFTPLSENNATDYYESGALDRFLKADLKSSVTLSQGFKVDLNDMNGKMKKQATYSPANLNDPISYTENFYSMVRTGSNSFKLNHQFAVMNGPDGQVQNNLIGREVELMTDFREHKKQTITTNIDFNVDVINGAFIPIPIPMTWKPVIRESNIYRSAATLKVVNHYSVLDSVVAVDKGSMVSTKNLVFDAETGDPLLTRTNNEHNRPVYSFSYPAHWAYSGMGMAYKNIDVVFRNVTFRNGKIDASPNVDLSLFESGDEILVRADAAGWQPVPGNGICEPPAIAATPATRIWAVNTGKAGSATPQWVFMDAEGNPFTANEVSIRIIRSGKRNMAGAGLGSVQSLENPVSPVTGKLDFTDATHIIQTSAATYKDHWRVDNALYVKDSVVKETVQARIKRKEYLAVQSYSVSADYRNGYPQNFFGHTLNPSSLLNRSKGFKHHTMHTDNWLLFDLQSDPVPVNATVYKGALSFSAHVPYSFTPPVVMNGHYNPEGSSLHPQSWSHKNYTPVANWPNMIGLLRMKTPWPATSAQWNNLFSDRYKNLHEWNGRGGLIGKTEEYSAKSYILTNNSDTRADFTRAVADMIADSRLPGNNFATGIRVMRWRANTYGVTGVATEVKNGVDVFQCFWPKDPRYGYKRLTPKLHVYYYICGDISEQLMTEAQPPGEPEPFDPLINQLITCNNTIATYQFCLSKFTQRKSVNPYVEGIWGNWRADTSFVYYGDRKENVVVDGQPVDTRKGGTITGYKPFWNLAMLSTGLLSRNYAASDVWTWNSTITQYNRKGYEVENKDPLGRFNAGLYGYNQQLPVAVVNNSRYMESLFDGFEDYGYQSNSCVQTCAPRSRVNMGNIQAYLSEEQKHSGVKSLKLNSYQSYSFSAPVMSSLQLDKPYNMRVRMDSVQVTDTLVNSNGNGLSGDYILNGVHRYQTDGPINLQMLSWQYNSNHLPPPGNGNTNYYTVWTGYIQPRKTGQYFFKTLSDDRIKVKINNVEILSDWDNGHSPRWKTSAQAVTMYAGQTYAVQVDYEQKQGPDAAAVLLWKNQYMSDFALVPKDQLYTTAPTGNVQIVQSWCTQLDSVNVRGNALTDTFSLVQDRKMVVSAWVKVGGNDCKCSTYVNNKIRISYTGSAVTSEFTPAGSIIEGWQRYEGEFTIPAGATIVNVELINNNSSPAWFDDLRIHPFNANMKSFVYNPQNLRLMSELDENNFASFYEYDDEGTLTRVKKETVKGVKTITETRSHLQKGE